MRYLIIGGAGVFALHTIKKILNHKSTSKVISVGRNAERSEAFTLGIGDKDKRFSYHQIHMTFENDRLIELIDHTKPNYIINFAALAHATSWRKSFRYYDTNITALAKLCEHLYNKKYLKQFLQIGSSEIYGSTKKPASETDIPNPTSPYAISKLAADYHVLSCFNHNNFPANVIRPSNCYGPTQLLYRIIPKAILYSLNNKKFPLEGGGYAKKSFMHADDLANCIFKILHSRHLGEIFNAGVNKPTTMRNIVKIIAKNTSKDFNDFVKVTAPRVSEDAHYWVNSSKANKKLNWYPTIDLETGIIDCIQWVKKYNNELITQSNEFVLKA